MDKMNYIDIFAGCGGLSDGFESTSKYRLVAGVEWNKAAVTTFRHRLATRWKYEDADLKALWFDVQRLQELFNGYDDPYYGFNNGLNNLIKLSNSCVDVVIGGPPCQAYSVAGRIRDQYGMRFDYRNYLFESYIEIVKHVSPKIVVFENVKGMLSSSPGGIHITERIRDAFDEAGFEIVDDLRKYALIDMSEYGVPQKRDRVILVALNRKVFSGDLQDRIKRFYTETLMSHRQAKSTVKDVIFDMPKLFPLEEPKEIDGKKVSHSYSNINIDWHKPRYHNARDIEIFRLLAEDIEKGTELYKSSQAKIELYTELTGKASKVHKYNVLRWNHQSNLIPAHLYKDGLRHIHPDPTQARSITIRESARLQTFDDDFLFLGSMGENYKMIGNAVPPNFSFCLAESIIQLINS